MQINTCVSEDRELKIRVFKFWVSFVHCISGFSLSANQLEPKVLLFHQKSKQNFSQF